MQSNIKWQELSFLLLYINFLNRLNMNSDEAITNIKEIFADNLLEIPSDDENMDICEND